MSLAVVPAGAREQRKTVTVLFCDLAGSTSLGETVDPERLRALLARYFERMKAIVERHGGSVEKFIGDAVMAVFGAPVVHEDSTATSARRTLSWHSARGRDSPSSDAQRCDERSLAVESVPAFQRDGPVANSPLTHHEPNPRSPAQQKRLEH